jgi:hypothetical protein
LGLPALHLSHAASPPPRRHLTRYFGILSSHAACRGAAERGALMTLRGGEVLGRKNPLRLTSALTLALYTMGRRDFFVLAFLIHALLGLGKLTLLRAFLIAAPLFVIAMYQVIWRMRGSSEPRAH